MTAPAAPTTPPFSAEQIEKAITELAAGMKTFNASRLKQDTIITLLHDHTSVPKRQIKYILNSLDQIEEIFLKPQTNVMRVLPEVRSARRR